ncbi:MAG: hypothetical protein HKP12_01560 [Gammaproteobacteria bacterium]|nr:hypothetical protein [Gammaproteobacteria bacterium]
MMISKSAQVSFRSVAQYPQNQLRIDGGSVQVPVTYKQAWDDGFGARGWKVNATIGDPEIIASTRETGQRINTSVFIHDILDHLLSGFGVSGHRSEAMALIQLSKRTGSDPGSDYEQLVREDILNGRVNGEKLIDFLPADLYALIPKSSTMTDQDTIAFLRDQIGEQRLIKSLVDNFFNLGRKGENHADASWKTLGLDRNKRTDIGLALQSLLDVVDQTVEKLDVEELHGTIIINNRHVTFTMPESSIIDPIEGYQVAIA